MPQIHMPETEVTDGLPPHQRWRAMLAVAIAVSTSVLVTSIANIALPTIAHDLSATPAELDLGGERLPARGDGDAAAVRLDGRHLWPSTRVYLWPCRLHHRIAALRTRAIAPGTGDRPRPAGLRRRRRHECQRRTGALHLPSCATRPRHRLQRADRRGFIGCRPIRRGSDHVDTVLALAVRAAGARGHPVLVAGAPLPSENAARRPSVRSPQRSA